MRQKSNMELMDMSLAELDELENDLWEYRKKVKTVMEYKQLIEK